MNFAALLRAFARRLLARATKGDVDAILRTLARQEPLFANLLQKSIMAAYLREAKTTARQAGLFRAVTASDLPPLRPPFGPPPVGTSIDDFGGIRFPGIEAAADWLHSRQLMTPIDFAQLGEEAKAASFTVARSATLDAVRHVRDAVADAYQNGRSLGEFREDVKDALDQSMLSPNRVETLYRSHVGQAQAAAQRAVLDHPLVGDEFPYVLFSATHDSRVEPSHLEMEKWGQNGTAVYRRDDPIWDSLWPPMRWNCRCLIIPLSIEDAARHGSQEARKWLATGSAPQTPEWAARPYPVTPPAGWPSHRGIAAVA
jgi:SPP1 gp7 family putative phage head morphogenesis protein